MSTAGELEIIETKRGGLSELSAHSAIRST